MQPEPLSGSFFAILRVTMRENRSQRDSCFRPGHEIEESQASLCGATRSDRHENCEGVLNCVPPLAYGESLQQRFPSSSSRVALVMSSQPHLANRTSRVIAIV